MSGAHDVDGATPDPNDPNPQTPVNPGHDGYAELCLKYDHCKRVNKQQDQQIRWLKGKLLKYRAKLDLAGKPATARALEDVKYVAKLEEQKMTDKQQQDLWLDW